MKRRRSRPSCSTSEPDLFAPRAAAWVQENWPHYARALAGQYDGSPLILWALTFRELPRGSSKLLITLCVMHLQKGLVQASLPTLAKASGSSVNATRNRLDALLAAGVVAVRLWADQTDHRPKIFGYEFKLLIDLDCEEDAARAGFVRSRKALRPVVVDCR